jgi:hypothetical protein
MGNHSKGFIRPDVSTTTRTQMTPYYSGFPGSQVRQRSSGPRICSLLSSCLPQPRTVSGSTITVCGFRATSRLGRLRHKNLFSAHPLPARIPGAVFGKIPSPVGMGRQASHAQPCLLDTHPRQGQACCSSLNVRQTDGASPRGWPPNRPSPQESCQPRRSQTTRANSPGHKSELHPTAEE